MNTAIDAAMERIRREKATELMELVTEVAKASDLERSELLMRGIALQFGAFFLEELLAQRGTGHDGQHRECASCGGSHEFNGNRDKKYLTLVGEVKLCRAYYPTGHECDANGFPLDEKLGIVNSRTTPGIRRAMSWMGAMEPFEKAEESFFTVSGLQVSRTLIWTTAETAGEKLAEQEEQGRKIAMTKPIEIKPVSDPIARLYGTMDGAKIHLQDGWKEIKVMAWYEADTKQSGDRERAKNVSYRARLESAEAFGEFFWAEGRLRGVERAKEIVILGDGAPWIWNLVGHHLPRAIQIVDYYHASEHLWDVGKAIFGEGTPATSKWVKEAKKLLTAGKIEKLIATFEKLKPIKRDARTIVRRNIE